jgi:hypothetical protein
MPGLDRTGPAGAGPMSGGRRGLCGRSDAVSPPVGYGGFGYGRGMGFGRGRGWGPAAGRCRRAGVGRRNWGYWERQPSDDPVSNVDEVAMLKADADAMRKSLEAIQRRIDELSQAPACE